MKSKFNWPLLLLCALVLFVPMIAFIATGLLSAPLNKNVNTATLIFTAIGVNDSLKGEVWHSIFMGIYIGCVSVVFVMAAVWVIRQAYISNSVLPNLFGSMWLKYILVPAIAVVVLAIGVVAIMMPLIQMDPIGMFWPFVVLLVQAAVLLPLQKPMHKFA